MRVQLNKFLVGIVIVLFSGITLCAQDPEMVRHYDYDKAAPIDLKIIGTEKRGDVTIYDITYASPKGGAVPAYLVVPKGNGPFAGVIWGHWYWSNSELYEAPHALNAEARRDWLAFLAEQLKLKRLSEKVIAAIPELYQPPRPTN